MGRKNSMARFNEEIEDVKIVGNCIHCNCEVYGGEEYVNGLEEGIVHRDCFESYALKYLNGYYTYDK